MKLVYVVDSSEEDALGEPALEVVDRFTVDDLGLLSPTPGEDYPDVLTETDLRRSLANSSFLSVWDQLPPGAMETRVSIDSPEPSA